MKNNFSKPSYAALFLITAPKLTKKASEMFKEAHVPTQYHFRARGTASSEMMDVLGLGSIEKNVIMSFMPKAFADKMLTKLQKELHLGLPDSGIAFTVSISGANGRMIKLIESLHENGNEIFTERDGYEMAESGYALIMAIVNQGCSEEVMDAAKPAGASGGTVFHSRRVGSEEAMKFWGITIQPEREVVMILAEKEDKLQIMQAIVEKCGMQTKGHGIVFSLPVDATAGLY